MLNQKIVAIIVTYNPNIKRFKLSLNAIKDGQNLYNNFK